MLAILCFSVFSMTQSRYSYFGCHGKLVFRILNT